MADQERDLLRDVFETAAGHWGRDGITSLQIDRGIAAVLEFSHRWRPIEEAPDGCTALVKWKGAWCVATRCRGVWFTNPGGWTIHPKSYIPLQELSDA